MVSLSDALPKYSTSPTGSENHLYHHDFKHLTEKYFEIGMKLNDFTIQLVKYWSKPLQIKGFHTDLLLFQVQNISGHLYRLLHDRMSVSYTHLRAHETRHDLVCRLLLEKKKKK